MISLLSYLLVAQQWGTTRASRITATNNPKPESKDLYEWNIQNDVNVVTADEGKLDLHPNIPVELMNSKVYSVSDFRNSDGRYAPYWFESQNNDSENDEGREDISAENRISWGPCFPPPSDSPIQWADVLQESTAEDQEQRTSHHSLAPTASAVKSDEDEFPQPKECYLHTDAALDGMCRPGFLIIGAGKCGTSSLYHYLVEHPRVYAARQKQIGFFKVCLSID